MAGKIKQMIDTIITQRSKGNETVARLTRAKLIMQGINPQKYDMSSNDDPVIIQKLQEISKELGISLN